MTAENCKKIKKRNEKIHEDEMIFDDKRIDRCKYVCAWILSFYSYTITIYSKFNYQILPFKNINNHYFFFKLFHK